MNRLFTLFAALLVGVAASAQLHIFEALNANNNFALTKCNMYEGDTYWDVALFYDLNGKISEMTSSYECEEHGRDVYNRTYQYDEKGNLTSEVELMGKNEEWEMKSLYENNYEMGILTGYVITSYDHGDYVTTETHTLTYDGNGNIIKDEINCIGEWVHSNTELFEYNSKNIITFSTSYSDTERYTYDENDRLIQVEHGCVENDCDVIIEKITYNADGTEAVGKHYEADGVTLKTDKTDSKYFFTKKTATPSRRTELDHVGAYNFKTVENGQIVIVRDGEKFDISGRKL
ncbi:MAG: hypothetical protein MJZ27_10125 [Bacteroidales bacterium]|nr:hypothetical protein [Bacteroidales bacterium]